MTDFSAADARAWVVALRCAHSPEDLPADRHEELIRGVLHPHENELVAALSAAWNPAPISPSRLAEIVHAACERRRLHDHLAEALRAAYSPQPIDPLIHKEIIEASLGKRQQHPGLVAALQAAWAPTPLDPAVNELLIEATLDDPLAPPTEDELVESQRLRDALDGVGTHPDAQLLATLQDIGKSGPLPEVSLTDVATAPEVLSTAPANVQEDAPSSRRRSNVVYASFGAVMAVVAVAAAFLLVIRPAAVQPSTAAKLIPSRTTSTLFSEKFERGKTSQRVDRIAAARGRDLRANRFAAWGLEAP